MSSHHILPKTHFNGKGGRGLVCRDCHNLLEEILLEEEGRDSKGFRIKLDPIVYYSLWNSFVTI